MVLGPNGPFTNLPPTIETRVEWIAMLIKEVNAKNLKTVEATTEAEARWAKTCQDIAGLGRILVRAWR
ncbi:hypothetical protein PY257_03895 [Ramlibacter sp. H39-3-26]|uniref:hypothetical protein n=1 Tax=Curvibacter soli TaxID=3031331 RepID=UPI0023DC235F|nr:hypothetical protein [Ramlibacter sp. H39-3-26]MDF1484328.1 hypothetical protein [Ramlibacter sp. H39-3-26]